MAIQEGLNPQQEWAKGERRLYLNVDYVRAMLLLANPHPRVAGCSQRPLEHDQPKAVEGPMTTGALVDPTVQGTRRAHLDRGDTLGSGAQVTECLPEEACVV